MVFVTAVLTLLLITTFSQKSVSVYKDSFQQGLHLRKSAFAQTGLSAGLTYVYLLLIAENEIMYRQEKKKKSDDVVFYSMDKQNKQYDRSSEYEEIE